MNTIHNYNFSVGIVDVAYQLRETCRDDHWSRNRKWCRSLLFSTLGVIIKNADVAYVALSTRNKGSARVNDHSCMNSEEQLHCIRLILMPQRRKRIIQQVIRVKHRRICQSILMDSRSIHASKKKCVQQVHDRQVPSRIRIFIVPFG